LSDSNGRITNASYRARSDGSRNPGGKMKYEEIKEWLDANFQPLLKSLGLSWWRVETELRSLDNASAECTTFDEYERSVISIDPALCADMDEAAFADLIRHEVLHITQAPYNSAHEIAASMLNSEQNAVLGEAFRQAKERNIRHLERLVSAITSSQEEESNG
jgi:hypothetical protein